MGIKACIGIISGFVIFSGLILSGCEKRENITSNSPDSQSSGSVQLRGVKRNLEEAKNTLAATVNGSPLTMYSLVQKMNVIAPHYIAPGQDRDPRLDKKIKQLALDRLIFEELAVQEARKRGLVVKKETVDEVIKRIKTGYNSEKDYKGHLESRGMTEDMLRQAIERGHLVEMITAKEVYEKITVPEPALRDRYEQEKFKFITRDNPPRQLTFEEVRGFLERQIKSETGAEKLAAWEKELKKDAKIEIKL